MAEISESAIPKEEYDVIAACVPELDAGLRELVATDPTDLPAVRERASVLFRRYCSPFSHAVRALWEQNTFFRQIFGHDTANNWAYCHGLLKDDLEDEASPAFEEGIAKVVADVPDGDPRREHGFMERLAEMVREFCFGTEEEPAVSLRELLQRIGVEEFSIQGFREDVRKAGSQEFDMLFFRDFGGSCVDLNVADVRARIWAHCRRGATESGDSARIVQDLLCLGTGLNERDLQYWRDEFQAKVKRIDESRAELWARMWTVLRTVEALGYWVPEHVLAPAPVHVVEFLRDAHPALQLRFDHNNRRVVKVQCGEGMEDLSVSMHQGTVAALLLNTVANASGRGGATEVILGVDHTHDTATLVVQDNGSGFEPDVRARLCDQGFSTASSTGLGLAHADRRMSAFGGSFDADGHGGLANQEGGKGARFGFTVPLVQES